MYSGSYPERFPSIARYFCDINQFIEDMARLKVNPTVLFGSLLFLFISLNANAQLGKRIKERIRENTERKVEDKIVNKAGEKTDQALDSLFKKRKRPGGVSAEKKTTGGSSTSNGNTSGNTSTPQSFDFGGLMNATYESSYTLDMEFKIEMKSQEKPKKKVETAHMDMYYGKDCYMMYFKDEKEKESTKALMDLKNNTSIVLNDQDMSGVAISMDFMSDKMTETFENYQDSVPEDANYPFSKTGRTKTIAGYQCEEYIIETDEMKMNTWYTDDITVEMYQNLDQYPMFGSFSSAITYGSQGKLQGTMMECHMVEKTDDKGTFDYLVKEVNLTTTTLNMSDYTFMKM